MSLTYVKFTPGFDVFMPKEYRDMVEHGPFGKKTTVSQMGSFKGILEEHPMSLRERLEQNQLSVHNPTPYVVRLAQELLLLPGNGSALLINGVDGRDER